jgi:hypothetical protein
MKEMLDFNQGSRHAIDMGIVENRLKSQGGLKLWHVCDIGKAIG